MLHRMLACHADSWVPLVIPTDDDQKRAAEATAGRAKEVCLGSQDLVGICQDKSSLDTSNKDGFDWCIWLADVGGFTVDDFPIWQA